MERDTTDVSLEQIVSEATARAKFKNTRLKKLKERNELYLMNRRAEMGSADDDDFDDDAITPELTTPQL